MRKLWVILIPVVLIGIFGVFKVVNNYLRPLEKIELDMPFKVGEENVTRFNLPKGDYVIKAVLVEGEKTMQRDDIRKVRCQIFSSKGTITDDIISVRFENYANENLLKKVRFDGDVFEGTFKIKLMSMSHSPLRIKIIVIRAVLFRTVV